MKYSADNFENNLKTAMRQTAQAVDVPQGTDDALFAKIKAQGQNGRAARRYISFSKKVAAVFCMVCCLSAGVVYAGGLIAGTMGHNIVGTEVYDYARVEQALMPKLDFEPKVIEEFANGYKFCEAHLGVSSPYYEDNTNGQEYIDLNATYTNGGQKLFLSYTILPQAGVEGAEQTAEINGVEVSYNFDRYRFVPPDYQPTEEEIAAMEAGELYMSYGSDEVEDSIISSVFWQQDGISHDLLGFDTDLTAEELFAMAAEIINADR